MDQNSSNNSVVPESGTNTKIYHEKQERMLCARHALNNLLQRKIFTSEDLNRISVELSPDYWLNPHKTPFFGNYDINVIIKALQNQSFDVDWFDRRLNAADQNFDEIFGFILNIPTTSVTVGLMTLPWKGKHWLAIKKINGMWYNLDSKLSQPVALGSENELGRFLQGILQNEDANLFVVKPIINGSQS